MVPGYARLGGAPPRHSIQFPYVVWTRDAPLMPNRAAGRMGRRGVFRDICRVFWQGRRHKSWSIIRAAFAASSTRRHVSSAACFLTYHRAVYAGFGSDDMRPGVSFGHPCSAPNLPRESPGLVMRDVVRHRQCLGLVAQGVKAASGASRTASRMRRWDWRRVRTMAAPAALLLGL